MLYQIEISFRSKTYSINLAIEAYIAGLAGSDAPFKNDRKDESKKMILNLNPPDNKSVYERYMKGTDESDITTLTELIFELVEYENEKKYGA